MSCLGATVCKRLFMEHVMGLHADHVQPLGNGLVQFGMEWSVRF